MLQNAGATGLPNWWGFSEDHTLLIEADEYGYYPNSRSRGAVSEGFISVFLQHRCKQHCKVAFRPCRTIRDKQHLLLDMKTSFSFTHLFYTIFTFFCCMPLCNAGRCLTNLGAFHSAL